MKTAIIVPHVLNEEQTAELHCANNGYVGYRRKEPTRDGIRYEFFEEGDELPSDGVKRPFESQTEQSFKWR